MPAQIVNNFVQELRDIEAARSRAEVAAGNNAIPAGDVLLSYEALFLRAVVSFEYFLETLFLRAVSGASGYPSARCQTLVTFASADVMRAVLLQRESYLDWLPFDRTLARASIYLKEGKPFSSVDPGQRSQLQQVVTIRHAIAHASGHAKKEFEDKVIGSTKLLPHERTPAGFLRSSPRPGATRFEVLLGYLAAVANSLR